jgi:hypothetical protein
MAKTHLGQNGEALCGVSRLLSHGTSLDIQTVDCTKCLWQTLGRLHQNADVVMMRIKIITDEQASWMLAAGERT